MLSFRVMVTKAFCGEASEDVFCAPPLYMQGILSEASFRALLSRKLAGAAAGGLSLPPQQLGVSRVATTRAGEEIAPNAASKPQW